MLQSGLASGVNGVLDAAELLACLVLLFSFLLLGTLPTKLVLFITTI